MAPPRLSTLRPRVSTLDTRRVTATPARAERIVGDTWMRIRDRILTRDEGRCRCAECVRLGRLLPAQEVDHVVPLEEGGSNDDANLAAINVDCHKRKSAAERARWARGERGEISQTAGDRAACADPGVSLSRAADGRPGVGGSDPHGSRAS